MKCFLNVFVVSFILSFLKINNGFVVIDIEQSEEDYSQLSTSIPEEVDSFNSTDDFVEFGLDQDEYEDMKDLYDASLTTVTLNDAQGLCCRIPEKDYEQIIRDHLAIGLTHKEIVDDQTKSGFVNEKEYSNDLLTWTQQEFNLTKGQVLGMVIFSQVCLPSGCVNLKDVGERCCLNFGLN